MVLAYSGRGKYIFALFCTSHFRDWTILILLTWVFGCSAVAQWIDIVVAAPERIRDSGWRTWVLIPIATLGFFALFIYPHLRWSLGGGAPLSVTLRFGGDKSPLDNSKQTQFWLIDETDAGFYVLDTLGAKQEVFLPRRALFIPRANVSAIYFGATDKENPLVQ